MDPEQSPGIASRTIDFLSRYAKTDVGYVLKNGWWLGFAQILLGLLALLLSIAFARFVPKETYGTYRFLLALFWTLSALAPTGIGSAMTRAVARGLEGTYVQSFRPFLVWSIPMSLVACGISIYYSLGGNTTLAIGLLLIALLGPLYQPSYLYGSLFDGLRKFRENAIFGVILNLVPTLGLIAAIFLTKNPLVFFALYLSLTIVTGAILCTFAYYFVRPNTESDPQLLTLGAHLSANNILASLAQQADKLLVFHLLGATSLATYSFAIALPEQVKSITNSLSNLAFPRFAARPIQEIVSTLLYRLLVLAGILAVGVACYWFLAPFLFHLLFPTYLDAVPYSKWYALALIPVINIIPLSVLESHVAKTELYTFNTIGPLFQIIALYVLIGMFGIWGAVYARILGRFFNAVLGVILVNHYARRTM